MKILVTGCHGQLAQSLQERAQICSAIELIAMGRPQLDLELPGSAGRVITAMGPDVVINAAAYTAVDCAEEEPERALRINADAAGEVAAAAAKAGARLIQISTDYVFDGCTNEPYDESATTNPLGVYGASKLAGEKRVRDTNSDHVIVRTAWVYSPFGRNFVKTLMSAAETRDTLTVVDDQRGNPSSALDIAEGLFRIVDSWRERTSVGLEQTYHLAGTGSVSWCGFAQAIMAECRRRGLSAADVQGIRTEEWPTKAPRPRNSVLDCGKFARDFGYVMPQWQTSLGVVVGRLADQR